MGNTWKINKHHTLWEFDSVLTHWKINGKLVKKETARLGPPNIRCVGFLQVFQPIHWTSFCFSGCWCLAPHISDGSQFLMLGALWQFNIANWKITKWCRSANLTYFHGSKNIAVLVFWRVNPHWTFMFLRSIWSNPRSLMINSPSLLVNWLDPHFWLSTPQFFDG